MSRFLEALESRTLLSAVTSATLAADNAAIVAAGANGTAAVKALVADVKTGLAAIKADIKTLPASNAALFNTLKTDATRFEATVSADLNLLIKPGESLSKKSTSVGQSLFTKATTKNVATLAAEITALNTVTTTPLANLLAAFHGNNVQADFQALVTANPTATQLATDVSTTLTNANTQITALQNDANLFSTNVTTLTTDLTSVKTTFGTFPNLVGTFTGTVTTTRGKETGRIQDVTFVCTSEDASGNVVATATNTDGLVLSLTGTITLNGVFAAKGNDSSNGSATLKGQLTGSTLTGKFVSPTDAGVFSFTKTL